MRRSPSAFDWATWAGVLALAFTLGLSSPGVRAARADGAADASSRPESATIRPASAAE